MTGRGGPALWRLAWRTARAQPARHLLIVVLIALAVAGSVATSIGARNLAEPPEVAYAAVLGSADLTVARNPSGVPYDELPPELQAEVDERHGGRLDPVPAAEVDARIRAAVPPEATIAITEGTYGVMAQADDGGRVLEGYVVAADPTDPTLAGLYVGDVDVVPGPGEVLLAPARLRDAGLAVGDRVELGSLGEKRIVGVASSPNSRWFPTAIVSPGTPLPGDPTTTWYVGGIDADVAERLAAQLDTDRGYADSRPEQEAYVYATPRSHIGPGAPTSPALVGSLVAVVLLVQVGFIAAAAFATGTRRRVRQFGLMAAAAGADPGHIRRLVRREALVLGLAGASIGAVVGLAATWLGRPLLERMATRPLGSSFQLAAGDVLLPVVLAILASLVAAWVPARTVAQVPVGAALAGRVPLRRVARWVVPLSLVAIVLGTAGTAARISAGGGWWGGRSGYTVLTSRAPLGLDHALMRTALLTVSVALLLAGIAGLAGPLVQAVSRMTGHLGVQGRLALRDSARQRTRSAAAVAATMVVMSAAILVFTLTASEAASWAAERHPTRDDVAVVAGPPYGEGSLSPTAEQLHAARSILPEVTDEHPVEVVSEHWGDRFELVPTGGSLASEEVGVLMPSRVGLVTTKLRSVLGVGGSDPASVVLNPADAYGQRLGERFDAELIRDGHPSIVVSVVVAATAVPQPIPELLVTEDVAEALGLEPVATFQVLQLASPPTEQQARAVWDVADAELPFSIGVSLPSEDGASTSTLLAVGGVGMLLALAIAAATAALAATESDHDLRTMAAVGADPRLRPRFRAWQAGLHVALGGVLAVPAGLLLAVMFQRDTAWTSATSVPVLEIAGFVVLCPLVVAAPFLLFSRRSPSQLSARRPA